MANAPRCRRTARSTRSRSVEAFASATTGRSKRAASRARSLASSCSASPPAGVGTACSTSSTSSAPTTSWPGGRRGPRASCSQGRTLVIRLTRPIPDFTARWRCPSFARFRRDSLPIPRASESRERRTVLRRRLHSRSEGALAAESPLRREAPPPRRPLRRRSHARVGWGRRPDRQRQGGLGPSRPVWPSSGCPARAEVRREPVTALHSPAAPTPVLRAQHRTAAFKEQRTPLRRAINFAVDRSALAAQHGYRSVQPTDQYLPIGSPGFRDARIYSNRPNLKKAKALARGHLRRGKAVLYTSSDSPGVELGQVMKQNLARDRPRRRDQGSSLPYALRTKLATRGEPFDIGWPIGWTTDYSDPYSFINVLLHGRSIGLATGRTSTCPGSIAGWLRRRGSRGEARLRAYGNLDIALAKGPAPLVAYARPTRSRSCRNGSVAGSCAPTSTSLRSA